MQKKVIGILLVTVMLLGALVSCGDSKGSEKDVYNLGDEDSYVSDVTGDVISLEGSGISAALYEYVYNEYKEKELAFYIEADEYYDGFISSVTPIEDTEKFWTTQMNDDIKSVISLSDDSEIFADVLLDRVDGVFTYLLVYEALANKYDFVPYRDYADYYEEVDTALVEAIKESGIVEETENISDDDGVIYDWVLDRWDTYLAGKGITSAEWVRVFCDYSVYNSSLLEHITENGLIEAIDEETARDELVTELQNYKEARVKFEYIYYSYITESEFDQIKAALEEDTEEETSQEESSETSAETGEESAELSEGESAEESTEVSEETTDNGESVEDESAAEESGEELDFYSKLVSESETYEEVNEKIDAICKEIYAGLLDGSRDFTEEFEACPFYEMLIYYYPDGLIFTKEDYTSVTGDDPDNLSVGEIKMYVNDNEIQIIKKLELTEDDISTEPTDDEVAQWMEQSVTTKFNDLIVELSEKVVTEDERLDSFKQPWKV